MVDHSNMRLGKLAARYDRRVPMLGAILAPELAPPPARADWSHGIVSWGMMGNDRLGDCTAAAVGHSYQAWTAWARKEWTPNALDVIGLYSRTTGYNPADPSTDQGGVELDVLTYLLKNGFCGRHIEGFVSIEPGDLDYVKRGIALFGSAYTGIGLPISAQTQTKWDVPAGGAVGDGAPGSWGGHAVAIIGYDEEGLTCVTWGALKKMTWRFWQAYADEAYAILAGAWIEDIGRSPAGVLVDVLKADMSALKG